MSGSLLNGDELELGRLLANRKPAGVEVVRLTNGSKQFESLRRNFCARATAKPVSGFDFG